MRKVDTNEPNGTITVSIEERVSQSALRNPLQDHIHSKKDRIMVISEMILTLQIELIQDRTKSANMVVSDNNWLFNFY